MTMSRLAHRPRYVWPEEREENERRWKALRRITLVPLHPKHDGDERRLHHEDLGDLDDEEIEDEIFALMHYRSTARFSGEWITGDEQAWIRERLPLLRREKSRRVRAAA